MNIRRGMFRFWILFTACWMIVLSIQLYANITSKFLPSEYFRLDSANGDIVKVDYKLQYDLKSTHYAVDTPQDMTLMIHVAVPKEAAEQRLATFYKLHTVRRTEELRDRKYTEAIFTLSLMFGIPMLIFVIGFALAWALSGFRIVSP